MFIVDNNKILVTGFCDYCTVLWSDVSPLLVFWNCLAVCVCLSVARLTQDSGMPFQSKLILTWPQWWGGGGGGERFRGETIAQVTFYTLQ